MITRIVKLTIKEEHVEEFRAAFKQNHANISTFPGCLEVRLVCDVKVENIHFTISSWQAESDLENYRNSELFNGIWSHVKPMFSDKAQAWSTVEW